LFFNNLDAVAEYQVVTNQFSAEYGRNLGASVNIITKGGTNDFHGALRWEYRGAGLNSKTSLQSKNNLRTPTLVDNRWSANVTGPIFRDRLFFTFGYTGREQPGGTSDIGVSSTRVLTPNGITTLMAAYPTSLPLQAYANSGPFSISDGSPSCVPGTTTTLSLGGQSVAPGPMGPVVVTGPTVAGVEACEIQRTIPGTTAEREYSTRIDWVTTKHTITGRYLKRDNTFCCSGGRDGFWIDVPDKQQTIGVTHTFTITPNLVNNFKFSWGSFDVQFEGGNTSPISQVRDNLTNFSMPSGFLSYGLATNLPQNRLLDTFQYSNTLSYNKGSHYMKFGVEFHRNLTTLFFLPFINGSYSFSSSTLNDFLNNTPAGVNFAAGNGSFEPREFDQFYFFQNDWKVTRNFTINIGARYEHNGQPINQAADEILARESDPSTAFWLQSVALPDRTLPRQPNDNNNVAPRIGFAWTPNMSNWITGNSQMTIRGGYGIAYELAFYNILLNMTTAAPRVFSFSLTCGQGIDSMTGLPTTTVCNTPTLPAGATGNDVASTIPVPLNTVDPRTLFQSKLSSDFHNPYGQNWSLGIQREIAGSQVVEVRYVGTNGVSLFQSVNINPRFINQFANFPNTVPAGFTPCATVGAPGFGRVDCNRAAIRERRNSGFSNYNSLQVRYDVRNFKNQLTGGLAYAWSKGIDNVSEIFGFAGDGSVAFSENPFNFTSAERGVSNQSLKQTLTMHYIWEMPWFRSQNGVIGKVLGGWSVSGITTLLSGRPWTPTQRLGNSMACGEDSGFNNPFVGNGFTTCRPFLSNPSAPLNTVGFFDAAGVLHLGSASGTTIVTPNDVRFIFNDNNAITFFSPSNPFGIGRNNFEGDGTVNFDIAVDKRVKITERIGMRYRMSMVNAFNHRNFGVPQIRSDLATFAVPENNNVGPNNGATPGGRSIRMILWVEF
jgi:hypothetical protein